MPYRIIIDRERCASNAECVSLAPRVFALDEEDIAIVLDPEGARDYKILDAARACPTDAIILLDRRAEQVWP